MVVSLTMNSVVLEQVDQVVDIHEGVVDRRDLSLIGVVHESGPEHESADSAESIDAHSHCAHLARCFQINYNKYISHLFIILNPTEYFYIVKIFVHVSLYP